MNLNPCLGPAPAPGRVPGPLIDVPATPTLPDANRRPSLPRSSRRAQMDKRSGCSFLFGPRSFDRALRHGSSGSVTMVRSTTRDAGDRDSKFEPFLQVGQEQQSRVYPIDVTATPSPGPIKRLTFATRANLKKLLNSTNEQTEDAASIFVRAILIEDCRTAQPPYIPGHKQAPADGSAPCNAV